MVLLPPLAAVGLLVPFWLHGTVQAQADMSWGGRLNRHHYRAWWTLQLPALAIAATLAVAYCLLARSTRNHRRRRMYARIEGAPPEVDPKVVPEVEASL